MTETQIIISLIPLWVYWAVPLAVFFVMIAIPAIWPRKPRPLTEAKRGGRADR